MLVSYYLPGNRSAHPPTHLVHGPTGHTGDEQTHFDASRIAGARGDEQCKLYNVLLLMIYGRVHCKHDNDQHRGSLYNL